MNKVDLEVFCNEIINFDTSNKNYWNMMDDVILKSLKIKGKKIPKEFEYKFEDKSVYFKKINKSLNFVNLLIIEDSDEHRSNYLNCGLLSFDDTLGIKKNIKILFIEEDFLTAKGMLENPTFVPIKLINNSKNLSKVISEEVIKYYNKYNRFGVKLPIIDHEEAEEMFDMCVFETTNVFINQDFQHFVDIECMEKLFKYGFNDKVKNWGYPNYELGPSNSQTPLSNNPRFRNYFLPKHEMAPAGPFSIYFYKSDFKEKIEATPNNMFKKIFFKE